MPTNDIATEEKRVTMTGAPITAAMNGQLFSKTLRRVVGSKLTGRRSIRVGNFQEFPRHLHALVTLYTYGKMVD